jgi:PKD repeat protein
MRVLRLAGLLALLSSVGCAYHNPTAPSVPAVDPSVPSQVTLGASPGSGTAGGTAIVTARVQNASGVALSNVMVTFTTTRGTVSPAQVATSGSGAATATLTASDTADVTAFAGTVSAHTLVIATPPSTPTPTPTLPLSFLNVSGSATVGLPVTFGVSSTAVGATWIWSFGDGAGDQGTAFTTTHIYNHSGVYTASVSSSAATASTATITVTDSTVTKPPPPALFAASLNCPPSTTLIQPCNITASSNGSTLPSSAITNVSWDWGDGGGTNQVTSAPVNVHTYANPGTYTIFATVVGAPPGGSSQQTVASVSVTVPKTP